MKYRVASWVLRFDSFAAAKASTGGVVFWWTDAQLVVAKAL